MPSDKVLSEYKAGRLHSGSKRGPKVKNRKQAVAIMLSEKRKEGKGGRKRKGRTGRTGRTGRAKNR